MASYILGASQGTSKKNPEKPFYILAYLTLGKYGRWGSHEDYITEKLFQKLQKLGLGVGDPCQIRFNADGEVVGIRKCEADLPRLELFTDEEEEELEE